MKLWSKTLIASAVCLFLAGCDDSSKVDANLDKAKDNAQQIKEAAADKAEAIKDQADKHIDAIKKQAADEANSLSSQASSIKAEADKKAEAIAQQAQAQADAVKQDARQKSDQIVQEAGKIKDNAIVDANNLASDAANKTKEIKESIAPAKSADDATATPQQKLCHYHHLLRHYLQTSGWLKIMFVKEARELCPALSMIHPDELFDRETEFPRNAEILLLHGFRDGRRARQDP